MELWERILANYGPTGLVLVFLIKVHWDTVYKVIPDAITSLRVESRKNRIQQRRLIKAVLGIDAKRLGSLDDSTIGKDAVNPVTKPSFTFQG